VEELVRLSLHNSLAKTSKHLEMAINYAKDRREFEEVDNLLWHAKQILRKAQSALALELEKECTTKQ